MKIPNWIKRLLQKNKKDMISEEQLISYKQNFGGQTFQWIKTPRPELMGKVVKVRDVDMRGTVHFDDGSKVPAKDLNNKLMMITGDMQPLTTSEVNSISKPAPSTVIPETPLPNGEVIAAREINAAPVASGFDPATGRPISGATVQTPAAAQVAPEPVINPFAMFNSDETEITLKMNIKIPDKKLLKMMYSNAENKEVFLDQLSKYVNSLINNTVVLESMQKMLDPNPSTKKATKRVAAEVQLTEVDETKK